MQDKIIKFVKNNFSASEGEVTRNPEGGTKKRERETRENHTVTLEFCKVNFFPVKLKSFPLKKSCQTELVY